MKTKTLAILSLLLATMLGFTATAFAATAVTPADGSLLDLARPVYDQLMAGHYFAATALALVLAIALLKRYAGAGKVGKFVHSDLGGILITFATATAGALATASLAGASWSWALVRTGGAVGLAAIGGYTIGKRLLAMLTASDWYTNKAPTWLRAAVGVASWVFDKPDAIKVAEAAGAEAVAAKPAPGVDGTIGKPEVF